MQGRKADSCKKTVLFKMKQHKTLLNMMLNLVSKVLEDMTAELGCSRSYSS